MIIFVIDVVGEDVFFFNIVIVLAFVLLNVFKEFSFLFVYVKTNLLRFLAKRGQTKKRKTLLFLPR